MTPSSRRACISIDVSESPKPILTNHAGLRSLKLTLLWIAMLGMAALDPDAQSRHEAQAYIESNIYLRRQVYKRQRARADAGMTAVAMGTIPVRYAPNGMGAGHVVSKSISL